MYQLLFFKPCYELITSRYNGIALSLLRSTVLNVSFVRCVMCAPCCLFTAKAYVHFDAWTTEKTVKYMNLCINI